MAVPVTINATTRRARVWVAIVEVVTGGTSRAKRTRATRRRNSGLLDGLATAQDKEKMTAWLA